jgi:hypothetical protein
VSFVVMLLVAGCGESAPREHDRAVSVVVPDVVDVLRKEAECRLAEAGLRWRTGSDRRVHSGRRGRSGSDAAGTGCAQAPRLEHEPTVVEQSPSAGTTVPRGAILHLEDSCTLLRHVGTACL